MEPARALWMRLAPLIEVLFAEPNPGPLKFCLSRIFGMSDALREPMMPIQQELKTRLDQFLAEMPSPPVVVP